MRAKPRSKAPAGPEPRQGQLWDVYLEPTKGHEQGGKRPCLVVSSDAFNITPHGLIWLVPCTKNLERTHALAVVIRPPEGGVTTPSVLMCHQLRSVAVERLLKLRGSVTEETVIEVHKRLAVILGL